MAKVAVVLLADTGTHGDMRSRTCEHLEAIKRTAKPRSDACEECGARSSLRTCLTCGHVGCCDSREGHATAHARETGHPIICALPRGNGFTYCYEHREYL